MSNIHFNLSDINFDNYFDESGYERRSSYYETEIPREIERDFNCRYEDLDFNVKNKILTEMLELSNRKTNLYKRQMVDEYRRTKAIKNLRDLNKFDKCYQQTSNNRNSYINKHTSGNKPGIVFRDRTVDKGDYWGIAEFDEEKGFVLEL